MPRTARRRWSKEFKGEIDGIALGETGPVIIHGYDPPAGGKWVDNVIPGKLGAFDRTTGEELWVSPCEVGYGRGFGAGFGNQDDIVVLGPGTTGYRIARMSLASGELLGVGDIRPFDRALVYGDMSITVTQDRLCGIMTAAMAELWSYCRDGERYHLIGRSGNHLFVVFTDVNSKKQGVLRLDVESGDFVDVPLPAEYAVIHEMAAEDGFMVLLVSERAPNRNRAGGKPPQLRLEAFQIDAREVRPLWRSPIENDSYDEMPEVSISLNSQKLYVASSALLEVRDAISGRGLGEWTLPGLDERVGWEVAMGGGLLAEETRASVFELPA